MGPYTINGYNLNSDFEMVCNVSNWNFIYRPTSKITLTGTHIKLLKPDGTFNSYALNKRAWISALADRDDIWHGLQKYDQICLECSDEDVNLFKEEARKIKYAYFIKTHYRDKTLWSFNFRYKSHSKILLAFSFPPTSEGLHQLKVYASVFEMHGKLFRRHHEIQHINKTIRDFKSNKINLCHGDNISGENYVKSSGSTHWRLEMPLHPLSDERVVRCFPKTDEGLKLAIAVRTYVMRWHVPPPWYGSTLKNITWIKNNKEFSIKTTENGTYEVEYSDSLINYRITVSTIEEAMYIRNASNILGDASVFLRKFKPITDFENNMMPIPKPNQNTAKKAHYLDSKKLQQVHDDLIKYIKTYNQLNVGKTWVTMADKKLTYPEIPKSVIEALYHIGMQAMYIPKYRKYFYQSSERMQLALFCEKGMSNRLLCYRPAKGTPFTFLTMVVKNVFDMVRNEMRQQYQRGEHEMPTMRLLEQVNYHTTVDEESDIEVTEIDQHHIADTIREDLPKYMKIADDMGMSFAEWLTLCKERNQIVTN